MEFISENWAFIVSAIAAVAVGVVFAIRFFKSSKEEQLKKTPEKGANYYGCCHESFRIR